MRARGEILHGLLKTLKVIGKTLFWVVCAAALVLVLILAAPGWFINTKTTSWAIKRFGASYRPTWDTLRVDIASPGFLTKRLLVETDRFCVDATDGSTKGCFPRLGLDATIKLGWKPLVSVQRLDRLVLHIDPLTLDSTKSPKAAKKAAEKKEDAGFVGLPELVPAPLRETKVGDIDVKIDRFRSISSSGTLAVDAKAGFSAASDEPLRATAYVVTKGTAPEQVAKYDARVTLDTDLFRKGALSFLQAVAKVRGSLVADANARIEQGEGKELVAKVDAKLQSAGKTLFAKLQATQTPEQYSARGEVGALDPAGPIRRAELRRCRFEAPLRPKTNRPKEADLKCLVSLEPKPFGVPNGTPAKALAGALKFHADLPSGKATLKQDAFQAKLDLSVGPAADFYHFFARLEAKFSGRTGNLPKSLKAEHKLDAGFTIDKFEDLVAYLKGTAYAIPAPIHVLTGPLVFSLRSSGPTQGEDHGFDYKLTSRLAHARQKLMADVTGRLMVKRMFSSTRAMKSKTQVLLKDVAVEVPYLKVGTFPSVTVDERIKTGDPARDMAAEAKRQSIHPRKGPPGEHDIRIVTEKPVILYTNLAKDPVPVSLDLDAKPEGMEGRIRVEPFKVEIFKQEAKIDHVTLVPHVGTSAQDLDGKIVYKKNDLVIDILLLGSTDKPQVDFQSTPPLARDEIVAVLFYGKSPGELDSEQQATVGNASAGMANGAFGVVSLYLLAATPIDYVGYDPATQTYQARFKLPGGATLSVGSNLEESRTLTLRKRIVKNVELETGVRRTAGEANAITTFLQWFRRY